MLAQTTITQLKPLDVAILGFPYDTSTSYRPGARFGPRGIRAGSSREKKGRSYNTVWGVDPYEEGLEIIDCGDVPITPFDAQHAFKQMEQAYRQILYHPTSDNNQWEHPRIISLGGDHSIVLPILRSLKTVYGPVSVIHLDSHLDTFQGPKDYEIDRDVVGFTIIEAHEIDDIGMNGIIEKVKKAVGDTPVYLSIDIDVLDPSIAPATGTPESGGWTTRELKRFLKGLEGLNMVGADVVEVSPPYDTVAETTSVAAADLIVDILAGMTKKKAFKPAPEVKDEL
ncbi:putative agmatinase 2 [Colletotrichum sp. SAR 10_99]|nr:putative agmatinase 2 [Colletotrichum sp. SAR 10_96]KAJ5012089.1 putative agmatinase 2 [Colletotrichum sp. SAR 10_99]